MHCGCPVGAGGQPGEDAERLATATCQVQRLVTMLRGIRSQFSYGYYSTPSVAGQTLIVCYTTGQCAHTADWSHRSSAWTDLARLLFPRIPFLSARGGAEEAAGSSGEHPLW
jgi:hypothetical protein